MADHLIDIVVPVFNGAKTIESAIGTLQKQTLRDFRIVVVDDGSTDDTPQILRKLASADPRIEVVTQPNRGIVDSRNVALARCEAEFVACLDADDLSAPDRLEKQVAYLRSHPDCVAVSGAVRHVDEGGRFLGIVTRLRSPEAADPRWVPAMEPYLVHPFMMARRSAIKAIGGYRHLVYAEDCDLYWRLQEVGRLHNMEDLLGDYRLHSDSVSSQSIVSGRIMSMSSQLAAISALRRRAGASDLSFPKRTTAHFFAAGSAANIFAMGCEGLTQDEIDHLEIALAGRLLEITSYRPYELELEDCRFIRSAMRKHASRLAAANRAALARSCSGTAARLLHRGLFQEAAALMSPPQCPGTIGRLALRAVTTPEIRTRLRRALGRDATVQMK